MIDLALGGVLDLGALNSGAEPLSLPLQILVLMTGLTAALAADPVGVRAMLTAVGGLGTGLTAVRDVVMAKGGAIDASTARYTRTAALLNVQKERIEADSAKLIDRLTKSFSQMDRQVALIKASQSYLTQQIAAWNSTNN